jgi:hypothetical protein
MWAEFDRDASAVSGRTRKRQATGQVSWISTKRIEQAASWRSRGAWGYGCAQPQAPCARGAQRQRDSLAVALPPRLVRRNRQTILYSIFIYVGIVFDRNIAKS